jgi:type I restriction enzyme R subunit
VELIRAFANLADEMEAASYDAKQQTTIKMQMDNYLKLRDIIRNASGERIDLKAYEADMRYLIDTYIQADPSVMISPFAEMSLLDVIVKSGIADAINSLPKGIKKNEKAVSETIENNVRSKITEDYLLNPAYFEQMSKLLDEIIEQRKKEAIDYAQYLKKVAELAKKVADGQTSDTPDSLDTPAKRALYNNLGQNEALALQVHNAVMNNKLAMWRDNTAKENVIKGAIYKVLNDINEVNRIFEIIKQQQEY